MVILAKNTTLFETFPSLAMATKGKAMKNLGQYLCNMCLVIWLWVWIADSNCAWVLENNLDTCLLSIWLYFSPLHLSEKWSCVRVWLLRFCFCLCWQSTAGLCTSCGTFVKWSVSRLSTLDKPTTALLVIASLLHHPTPGVSWFISCINICHTFVHLPLENL